MVDELDQASERMEFDTAISVSVVCAEAKKFNPGQPGDCDLCGEYFERVVEVEKNDDVVLACGRCRDRHGLT